MERASENRRPVVGKTPGIGEMLRRTLRDINNFFGAPSDPSGNAEKPMLEKSGEEDQKPALVSRPPMKRKFAAFLTHNEQVDHQPIVTDAAVDIDSADSWNPLAATEYVEEIYKFYRENEETSCVHPDYMSSQEDINEKMRAILIDWLIKVHYKYELRDEILFLTVNIIDRYLEKQVVPEKKLKLVGVTAMLIAWKYEDVSVRVKNLVLISDQAYTKGQILEMEKLILNALQFNVSVPTPYVFMRRFLKAAHSDKQLELLSCFILELSLVEYQMLKYKPSLLAAAAVYTAQCAINRCQHWTKICELHSRYTGDQLLECSRMMVDFHQKAGAGKLTGVHRKYSTFKFGCAAKAEPALFLLGPSGAT